jgi:hypothetical protein
LNFLYYMSSTFLSTSAKRKAKDMNLHESLD